MHNGVEIVGIAWLNVKRFHGKMTRRRERLAGIEGAHSLSGSNFSLAAPPPNLHPPSNNAAAG